MLGGAAALGCSDSTGPGSGSGATAATLVLTFATPPSDSLGQRTVAFSVARSDSARLSRVQFYVDSGAGSTAQDAVSSVVEPAYGSMPAAVWRATALLPGPGRHTITVVGVDTAGRALGASAAWTVRIPTEAYILSALPDSGAGGEAFFVHANGTVAGSVVSADGRERAALWRNGALSILALPDSFHGAAKRVNAAGDVLLDGGRFPSAPWSPGSTWASVLRADGTLLPIGPTSACCTVAADLTETRLALGSLNVPYQGQAPNPPYATLVLDVARGVRVDSMTGSFVALNTAGQALGAQSDAVTGDYSNVTLIRRGFTSAPAPDGGISCDLYGRYTIVEPIDLDESADVLAAYCGTGFVWLPPAGGTGRWLYPVLGPSQAVHLSRTGGVVASLDPTGAIYLWRPATNRVTQVQVASGAWKIDALASVNASGQIAAHGVETATGRKAALLLTPAP